MKERSLLAVNFLSPKPGILLIGPSHSGKTTLARDLLRIAAHQGQRVIACVTAPHHLREVGPGLNVDALTRPRLPRRFRLIVNPENLDAVCGVLCNFLDTVVFLDDLDSLLIGGYVPPNLRYLVRCGRHAGSSGRGLSYIIATGRPYGIGPVVRDNVTDAYLFRLNGARSLKWIEEELNLNRDCISKLKKYTYLRINLSSSSVSKNVTYV